MKAGFLIDRLERHAAIVQTILQGVDDAQARWRSAPEKWSILEVLCHLLDEEREDFRQRLDLTLHRPEADWPPIDPRGWVLARSYAARELGPTLDAFLEERAGSIRWLRGLASPSWPSEHRHPVFGSMSAGDLLASWVAHDLLHVRQILELQRAFAKGESEPYSTEYAGG